MHFQPIDEMSLRHLFSSSYAEGIMRLSYFGPVLNDSGAIETSPDCLILDRRGEKWRLRRCEFKWGMRYAGGMCCPQDFVSNGRFDT